MEYLFRGKRALGGEWIEGDYAKTHFTKRIVSNQDGRIIHYIVHPESIGMWSGLTTKGDNLVKVFEGDIIWSEDYIGIVRLGRCKQVPGGKENIGFYVEFVSGDDKANVRNDLIYWIEQAGAQVIGNVTDNPELVEVTTND